MHLHTTVISWTTIHLRTLCSLFSFFLFHFIYSLHCTSSHLKWVALQPRLNMDIDTMTSSAIQIAWPPSIPATSHWAIMSLLLPVPCTNSIQNTCLRLMLHSLRRNTSFICDANDFSYRYLHLHHMNMMLTVDRAPISSARCGVSGGQAPVEKRPDTGLDEHGNPTTAITTSGAPPSSALMIRLLIPVAASGLMIGRGGSIVKQMTEQSGCRMQMADPPDPFNTKERIMIVTAFTLDNLLKVHLNRYITITRRANASDLPTPCLLSSIIRYRVPKWF